VKTWGFSGNCVLVLGLPYLFLSVAHGTAHDIVGQGVADPTMMINAMALAGSLAAGNGFGDTA
jgi:4-hydroxy-L-threonine phosphate dehydrogenase PdxA